MGVSGLSTREAYRVLWAKSDAAGRPTLLLQHLLDTAAVAELLWDVFLADAVRRPLDSASAGRGRDLFVLLAGWHDLGKATPGFQGKVPELAARVDSAGLATRRETRVERWRHEQASAAIAREVLRSLWPKEHVDWFWPLLAGHHGRVPRVGALRPEPRWLRGGEEWVEAQHALAGSVVSELGLKLAPPTVRPSRSRQLALAGYLIMADWIASDERQFPGVDMPDQVSVAAARVRARRAVTALGLRRGFAADQSAEPAELSRRRFGVAPRPLQGMVAAAAADGPGLLVVEAPMGEGKTEAALLAAELLARRSGQDGVFVGLPTQATSDPMFTRVQSWLASFPDPPQAGLLHGKRALNPEWQALHSQTSFTGVDDPGDDFGLTDLYGPGGKRAASGAQDWFVGPKRGLLQPVAVGTVDQLLHAATRTRHVMLRHAGLASGVVVVDEVHAYDVYMAEFLHEALRWAAAAGVPVVLLSATLPPAARDRLVAAYQEGLCGPGDAQSVPVPVPASPGYPSVLTVAAGRDGPSVGWRTCLPFRPSRPVAVRVLPQGPDEPSDGLVRLLTDRLHDGGTCLVVRNTVGRAQDTYRQLQRAFPGEVSLLHARFTAGVRADRAEALLRALGPRGGYRPQRLVVVATQVAEQSFDIDADLVVSDLAPIDLLLQRVGRLHRHDRPVSARPARVREPELVVTGMAWRGDSPPQLAPGSVAVYGEHLLLRAAALVERAVEGGWDLPRDVPGLVEAGYARDDELVPAGWREPLRAAREREDHRTVRRQAEAQRFLLSGPGGLHQATLAGLHAGDTADVDEETVSAVVRDGEESVEVTLVQQRSRGYATLTGRPLGPTGEAVHTDSGALTEVAAATVRLPASPATRSLTAAARKQLTPLPGWQGVAQLRYARALMLDETGTVELAGWRLRYDPELGLLHERAARS